MKKPFGLGRRESTPFSGKMTKGRNIISWREWKVGIRLEPGGADRLLAVERGRLGLLRPSWFSAKICTPTCH